MPRALPHLLLLLLMLLLSNVSHVDAGMNMRKGGPSAQRSKDKEKAPVLKADLPYIACHVCEDVVEKIHSAVEEERKKSSKRKVEEAKIIEIMDGVCRSDLPSGQWLREIDIAEEKSSTGGRYLALSRPGGMSKCQTECATVERSCSDLLNEDVDRDELSAIIWKDSLSLEKLKEKACVKLTKRCSSKGKPKYLPAKFKRMDHLFEEISDKDLQMEQLMAQMKESGLGGMSMYNRDDMAAMAGLDGDEDDDENNEGLGDDTYDDQGEAEELMRSHGRGGQGGGGEGLGAAGGTDDQDF